jgi:hypothetical protein
MAFRFIRISGVIVAGLLCVQLAAGQAAKVDVTGSWIFTIMSEAGTGTPTVTFKQDGEKLTGHYSSMLVGEADLTGTVRVRPSNSPFALTLAACLSNSSSSGPSKTRTR